MIVTGVDSAEAQKRATEMLKRIPTADEQTEILVKQGEGEVVQPDTEFVYPSGWKRHGFYMDKTLKTNLDNFLIPAVAASWDGVGLVTGIEGSQPAGSKVLMIDGSWKSIEDIKKGDDVFSLDKNNNIIKSKVITTHINLPLPIYNIREFHRNKNILYSCSGEHTLLVNVKNNKNKKWNLQYFTAEEYLKRPQSMRRNDTMSLCPEIKTFEYKNCELNPYALGVYLGDGSFLKTSLKITTANRDIITKISKYYDVMSDRDMAGCRDYHFSTKDDFALLLKKYNLYGKKSGIKFIPQDALLSDSNYRKELLAGLMDTDGWLNKCNTYLLCSKSEQMINDIKQLVCSLGGRATITKTIKRIKSTGFKGLYYQISFYIGNMKLPLVLKRKQKKSNCHFLSSNRCAVTIEKSDKILKTYGFELDSISGLYITDNWVVTHNSAKSTNAMSLAKYLDNTFPGELIDPEKNSKRTCDRIVFTPNQFMEAIDAAKPKQAIVFDEAALGFLAADASTDIQKALIKKMITIRKKNLYILIVLPSIFLLRMYMAIFRTRFAIHFYTPDGISRGYFKFYSYESKRKMYIKGKKNFDQDADKFDFGGRATDTQGLFFNLDDYEAKKDAAIRAITQEPELKKGAIDLRNYAIKGQRDVMIWKLYNDQLRLNPKMTYSGFATWLQTKFGEVLKFTPDGTSKIMQSAQQFLDKPTVNIERKSTQKFDTSNLEEKDLV